MITRPIFRKVALERLSSPDQLDQVMHVTNPQGWLALTGIGVLIAIAITWAIVGTLPIQVSGNAILLRSGGIRNVVAVMPGQLSTLKVQLGDTIVRGQLIAEVRSLDNGTMSRVVSPYDGRVIDIRAAEGAVVGLGESLVSIEPIGPEANLEAVMYISPEQGQRIRPGMTAQISPATIRREEYGFMVGRVVRVGEFPATYQGMYRTLGSDELVRAMAQDGTPIEVVIALAPSDSTPSGYVWSSSQGPALPMNSGTLGNVTVILGEQRPIELVLP